VMVGGCLLGGQTTTCHRPAGSLGATTASA